MIQSKFSIANSQAEFLNNYINFGFKDKSSMVRAALDVLKRKLEIEKLKISAELYTEIYEKDEDLQELTESASNDWLIDET